MRFANKEKQRSPALRYLDFLRLDGPKVVEKAAHKAQEWLRATFTTASLPLEPPDAHLAASRGRGTNIWTLFFVLPLLLILPGNIFLYDARTHPLTADSGQLLIGSICLAYACASDIFSSLGDR